MSADRWRLVDRGPSGSSRHRSRRLVFRLLDRLRGRLGVRVLRVPGRTVVLAESVDAVRAWAGRSGTASRLTLAVLWWRAPRREWGRVRPCDGVRVHSPLYGRGLTTVDVEVTGPVPTVELVTAAASALRPRSSLPGASLGPSDPDRVLVDAERVNPRGRRFEAYLPGAHRLALSFDDHPAPRWLRGFGPSLSWPTTGALRTVAAVTCDRVPGQHPAGEASLLVELAMTGVVLHVPNLPAPVADRLAPSLCTMLAEPVPDDPLELELRSVRQRRTALRQHSRRFGGGDWPTVSALLATRRPENLPAILRAMLAQSYPNLEIVLCLHGIELPVECATLLAGCGRPYEVVPVPETEIFGAALGLASARASGSLLTKFDDDDTYGPDHVWDLVLARHYSGATLVGKGAEFVYLEDNDLTIRRWSGRPSRTTL